MKLNKMSEKCSEKSKEYITEECYKEILTNELERAGSGGLFVWLIFFLCVTPNILNGFHVASYTLLGHLPDDQWCGVRDLNNTKWTTEEKRNITQHNLDTNGCTIWDWDYEHLSKLSYEDALNYTETMVEVKQPTEISCKSKGTYEFKSPENTFVTDWELICDRAILRTSAQMVLSLGKFFGSFSFGILADRFGRKTSFTLGAAFYLISSFFCTLSPWYSLFLVGRFGLGAASAGLFYPGFTMIVENICLKHRSWMSIAFSASYPVGMILLALAAYLVDTWRYLQLTLTLPALLLIVNCYFMNESPRWLITKKKYDRAYKVLFKQKSHYEIRTETAPITETATDKKSDKIQSIAFWNKLREGPLEQFIELFETWKVRKLILTSYFMFCVTSLCYYVTALNAANLSITRYLYVAVTGMVDMPSYLLPVVMLRYVGRRITTMCLFFLTGVALLLVLAVPQESKTLIIVFAMLGRFGITATYAVVTLYTAELYPTEIRNSAIGTCSTWAHVGSISAPYVVDVFGALAWYIPTTICGCCVIVAGLLTLTLPETGKSKITDRIEDVPDTEDDELTTDEIQCNGNHPEKA